MKVEQKYTYTQEVQGVRKKGYEGRVEIYIHSRGKVEQKYTYIQEVQGVRKKGQKEVMKVEQKYT